MTHPVLRKEATRADGARIGLKSLLLVGLKKEPVEALVPALRRRAVEVASTVSGSIAVATCRHCRYGLIIVREPVHDLALEDLLAEIRRPGAPCEHAYVQVLTSPSRVEELAGMTGRQLSVRSITDFGGLIATVSRVILGISPRVELRLMAELMVRLDGGQLSRFCQVENVSESGLLIRTADLIAVGELVEVVLSVPGSARPLRMSARVARHTGSLEVTGFALELVDYKGTARRLWRDYLRSEVSKDDTQPLRVRRVGGSG